MKLTKPSDAANPTTVIALIGRVRELEGTLGVVNKHRESLANDKEYLLAKLAKAQAVVEAARKLLSNNKVSTTFAEDVLPYAKAYEDALEQYDEMSGSE